MTNPGFTPVPMMRAPVFWQSLSSFTANLGWRSRGKSSYLQEETTLIPRRVMGSIQPDWAQAELRNADLYFQSSVTVSTRGTQLSQPRIQNAAVASKYQRQYEQGLGLCARRGLRGLDRPAFPGEVDLELKKYRVMKTQTFRMCLFASLGAAFLVALSATAQTPAPSATAPSTSAAPDSAPAKLPYGVEDVLKLNRAQVSEDVTLSFIHNSGTIYNLGPSDIVYLRNQGVSDRVINTMLDQRKNVPAETAAQTAPPSAPASSPAPVYSDANAAAAAQASTQYAPTYAQPAPAYVQPEPTYAPASTVYVIPYASSGYYYPSYYPYYGGYYGYYGPSVVFGFGYRGGGYYGGYHGSYHGGYHGGGHYGYGGHH
jgi:hypothetical protein